MAVVAGASGTICDGTTDDHLTSLDNRFRKQSVEESNKMNDPLTRIPSSTV